MSPGILRPAGRSGLTRAPVFPAPPARLECPDSFPPVAGTSRMKALFLLADGFEDVQFFTPYHRLREEGVAIPVACAADHQPATGLHGYTVDPDMPIPELNPSEYDVLVIPGGRSPERLRLREEAVDLARTFAQDGTLIAAIGHGPQLLSSAGALDGKSLTCDP